MIKKPIEMQMPTQKDPNHFPQMLALMLSVIGLTKMADTIVPSARPTQLAYLPGFR